jgi:RNA polymerase sigma-70 factor, ECF subfamily
MSTRPVWGHLFSKTALKVDIKMSLLYYFLSKKKQTFTSYYMETNNTETFKKIYESKSDAIFRFCLVKVSDRQQALDLTQETFLRLWQTIIEGKKLQNEKAFLFTVAYRLIVDWYRKKKSFSLDKMMENENTFFEVSDEKTNNSTIGAEGRYLFSKINELSPTNRESVYLRFVENLSPQEIGSVLNVSANIASVRINRGLDELRKITGYNNENK